jgi:hypothetical protein
MGRYPTSYPDGPAAFAAKLSDTAGWKSSGGLEFLNDWTYKLGSELLTPFGRSQLCKPPPSFVQDDKLICSQSGCIS